MSCNLLCLIAALLLSSCQPKAEQEEPQGSSKRRPDLRIASQNNLRQIGIAYLNACSQDRPPANVEELKAHLDGPAVLQSPRDQQPYEIVWGVDLTRLPDGGAGILLAWEKTGDKEGGRCVLLGNGQPGYVTAKEFEDAKGKGRE